MDSMAYQATLDIEEEQEGILPITKIQYKDSDV